MRRKTFKRSYSRARKRSVKKSKRLLRYRTSRGGIRL